MSDREALSILAMALKPIADEWEMWGVGQDSVIDGETVRAAYEAFQHPSVIAALNKEPAG